MADFSIAYSRTMHVEGGYDNNPNDPGGETFKGVSRIYNPDWKGWAIIDQIKSTHPHNLDAALNADAGLLQQIMEYYKVNYWDVNNTDLINDQQLASQIFDTAVNCGIGTAARLLQEAAGVTADRQIGPVTLNAVNSASTEALYNKFLDLRKQYYLNLISARPALALFEKSWMSRLWPYREV